VRRDTGEKTFLSIDAFIHSCKETLEDIQQSIYNSRLIFREENTTDVTTYDELKEVIEKGGFARTFWAGDSDMENRIQEETKATIRCILFEKTKESGLCVMTGKPSTEQVIFAKSY
ncbi:TPA: proline--tRNA ligase, partial [Candidatus Marinimicrobia bacterium]|nr:proline--tRNA ligase [Candidatus Neomarinimicrobiota bacterium]